MSKLSILIPARNEEWLKETVEDILKNIEADTEIIVVLDGEWAVKPLKQHERLTVVYLPESMGQRAGQNLACRLSKAKYVMKVDAHCCFDKGFDRKLIENMNDNWTVVPAMKNLHVFDWVCRECENRRYQGQTDKCPKCGGEEYKDVVWFAKPSPYSTSYRFNDQLEFKYFGEYKKRQYGDIVDTMSLQGSCFMTTREKYWERELCDETWGSWGGQGAEVAIKTWLSGGEVKCIKKTWYAHLFRTQGGDFGFPYPNPGSEQKSAKNKLRETFLNNAWHKQVRNLEWIVEKFSPVPDWGGNKGIIFYTDNQVPIKIGRMVKKNLKVGLPITSSSLKPMQFGDNKVFKMKRGREAYFTQILSALERSKAGVVFFCEHDVLYHPSHFEFVPTDPDKYYFNVNVWKWRYPERHFLKVDDCKQISGMVCHREKAIEFYTNQLNAIKSGNWKRHYEPQLGREAFKSEYPNIDIRHTNNLTKNRWSKDQFKNKKYTQGWTEAKSVSGWDL